MTLDVEIVSDLGTQIKPTLGGGYVQILPGALLTPVNLEFRITPGKRFYTAPNGDTKVQSYAEFLLEVNCQQDFTTVSNVKNFVDAFFQGTYTPPTPGGANPYRIDKALIVSIDAVRYTPDNTIDTIAFHCIMKFTLL